MVNVSCSHAAHFEEAGQRNYRNEQMYQMQIYKNYKRVALTWLDEYEATSSCTIQALRYDITKNHFIS